MKPYSADLRERVLAAVDRGTRRDEVCATFAVPEPTVRRWLRRRRETGGLAAHHGARAHELVEARGAELVFGRPAPRTSRPSRRPSPS